jgi:PTS system cellobiose-specific IIB component
MRTVLVVCGAGASSTFLALAMRTRAAHRDLALHIQPIAESQLQAWLPQADALLVGMHLGIRFPELQSAAASHGVPAVLLSDGDVRGAAADRAVEAALSAMSATSQGTTFPASDFPHQSTVTTTRTE